MGFQHRFLSSMCWQYSEFGQRMKPFLTKLNTAEPFTIWISFGNLLDIVNAKRIQIKRFNRRETRWKRLLGATEMVVLAKDEGRLFTAQTSQTLQHWFNDKPVGCALLCRCHKSHHRYHQMFIFTRCQNRLVIVNERFQIVKVLLFGNDHVGLQVEQSAMLHRLQSIVDHNRQPSRSGVAVLEQGSGRFRDQLIGGGPTSQVEIGRRMEEWVLEELAVGVVREQETILHRDEGDMFPHANALCGLVWSAQTIYQNVGCWGNCMKISNQIFEVIQGARVLEDGHHHGLFGTMMWEAHLFEKNTCGFCV
mmetsp:Transcript_40739/g.102562  ORF Transcript_40739/g.102562 Transcript_40739/m.102562 type:complete len:307 (-) Transcript_40739:228-1148(-)